jgi:hypothetical protein
MLALISYIEFQKNRTSAESGYLLLEGQEMIAIAAGKNQIGTSPGECPRKILTQATAGSGDNRHSSVEIKEMVAHHGFPGARTTFIRLGSRA